MYIYCDETGSTGDNLFDPSQSFYVLAATYSPMNLDSVFATEHRAICDKLHVQQIHAKELGLDKIEYVAAEISEILRKSESKFFFSVIEKPHLAGIIFMDLIMDDHLNPAVSPLNYQIGYLRWILTQVALQEMDLNLRKQFWQAYIKGNVTDFKNFLLVFVEKIISSPQDPNAKDRILTAAEYAFENPKTFILGKKSKYVTPAVVGFNFLLNNIVDEFSEKGLEITRFLYDQQKDFGAQLKFFYDKIKNLKFNRGPFGIFQMPEDVQVNNRELEFVPATDSFGVQISDLVNWLSRYASNNDMNNHPKAGHLMRLIDENSTLFPVTSNQLMEDAKAAYESIKGIQMTPAQIAKAEKIRDDLMAARKKSR